VMHTKYLKHTNIIQAQVQSVTTEHVVLPDRNIPYDYLVINSGSNYTQPFKESSVIAAARANTLRESYWTIKKVHKILIIGGGIVGVELAAEISTHFPHKEITIVHGQSTLINRFPKGAIKYCENYLRKRGVRILVNERIIGHRGQVFITDQAKEISCEVAFLCTGIQPNSSLLRTEELGHTIAQNGFIKANDFLQLQGRVVYPNIFVAGDVIDRNEEKLAQGAESQARIVANNIKAMESGVNLARYSIPIWHRPVLISLGKFHGVFVWGRFSLGGPLPALLKEAVEWKTLVRYW